MELKKNDEVSLEIIDLTNTGEGIGKIDGFPLFVKDCVPGDRIRAKVMKVKKNYGFARLVEVEEPSADRVSPKCPVARPCGGCQLQSMNYEAELKYKAGKVHDCLLRIGGIPEKILKEAEEPIIGMEKFWRYRNKAQYPIGLDKEGNPAQVVSRESAHEVWKVCSALEKYRQDFFKTPKETPTNDQTRETLADFRLALQYLTPENKKKMEALDEIVGYNLPENVSLRIAQHRERDYDSLQEMAKALKKDKKNSILKNALTEKSRRYVEGFFRDIPLIVNPEHVVKLGDMALKVNSLIPMTPYGAQYKKTKLYRKKNIEILSWIQKGYLAIGSETALDKARSTRVKIINELRIFDNIEEWAGEQARKNFEKSPASYNFR